MDPSTSTVKTVTCQTAQRENAVGGDGCVWHSKEIKNLYRGVYILPVQDSQEDEFFDAIAGAPGSKPELADRVAWTEVPYDFLLDKSEHSDNE